MAGAETETTDKKRDRKLGDEWADWNGDPASFPSEINENRSTFFALSAVVMFLTVAGGLLAWYLIKPRVAQFDPAIAEIIQLMVISLAVILTVLFLAEGFSLMKFGKSFFPYKVIEGFVLYVLPKAVWLGGKFGINRDRVGHSFIKVHNFITRSHAGNLRADRLLILLPRCLRKEARSRITDSFSGNGTKILTVVGGEEAREAIRQYRPDIILAIACERDLMSGIKDVAEKIPVIAIANKRPEGPCKNTDFSVSELEDAIRFIAARRTKKLHSDEG